MAKINADEYFLCVGYYIILEVSMKIVFDELALEMTLYSASTNFLFLIYVC